MRLPEPTPTGHYASCVVILLDTTDCEVVARPITMLYESFEDNETIEKDVLDYVRSTPEVVPEGQRVIGVYVTHTWQV